MFRSLTVSAILLLAAGTVLAIQQDDQGTLSRSTFNPTDPLLLYKLAKDPRVANELGINPSALRIEGIRDIQSSIDLLKAISRKDLSTDERKKATEQANDQRRKKQSDILDETLPPEKMKRLIQIAYRLEILGEGFEKAFAKGWMSERIGLSDQQRDEVLMKLREIDAETEKQMELLMAEAERKMLDSLTIVQRQQVEDVLGPRLKWRIKHPAEIFSTYSVMNGR